MENKQKKLFNLAYDSLYNLKYNGRCSNVLRAKLEIIQDDIETEAKKYGYDFRLNDRTQKFQLKKIQ